MDPHQAITAPFGITVFGSALSRVAPDHALLRVAVAHTESKPGDAFAKTRQGAQAVQTYLQRAGITDFGASRIGLTPQPNYPSSLRSSGAYEARISYTIRLSDLDRVEAVLTGLVSAGANTIEGVDYQTTLLKEVRADARRRAVAAAHEKATNYCNAAGVTLGAVLHIEDVNPNVLRGHDNQSRYEPAIDDTDPSAIDAGSLTIGAAVLVAYAIASKASS